MPFFVALASRFEFRTLALRAMLACALGTLLGLSSEARAGSVTSCASQIITGIRNSRPGQQVLVRGPGCQGLDERERRQAANIAARSDVNRRRPRSERFSSGDICSAMGGCGRSRARSTASDDGRERPSESPSTGAPPAGTPSDTPGVATATTDDADGEAGSTEETTASDGPPPEPADPAAPEALVEAPPDENPTDSGAGERVRAEAEPPDRSGTEEDAERPVETAEGERPPPTPGDEEVAATETPTEPAEEGDTGAAAEAPAEDGTPDAEVADTDGAEAEPATEAPPEGGDGAVADAAPTGDAGEEAASTEETAESAEPAAAEDEEEGPSDAEVARAEETAIDASEEDMVALCRREGADQEACLNRRRGEQRENIAAADREIAGNMESDGGLEVNNRYNVMNQAGRGPCAFSNRADRTDCEATKALAQASDFTVQALNGVGAAAVSVVGQAETAEMADPDAGVSDIYGGAKNTATAAAISHNTTGAAAMGLGIALLARAAEHGSDAGEMEEVREANNIGIQGSNFGQRARARGDGETAQNANDLIDQFEMDDAASMSRSGAANQCDGYTEEAMRQRCEQQAERRQANRMKEIMQQNVNLTASTIEGEQSRAATEATLAGMKMLVQSAASIAKGTLAAVTAANMDKIQNQLEDENTGQTGDFDTEFGFDPLAESPTGPGGGGPGVTPGSQDVGLAATGEDGDFDESEGLGELPTGNDGLFGDRKGGPEAPILGFQNIEPNSGGGAGGGAAGVGSTSPSSDEPTTAAAEASNAKSSAAYGGGRGRRRGGRGGGGGGGSGIGVDGLDMDSLLAQFLPQGEEEKAADPNSMEFGEAQRRGRYPASLLGRETNIFDRIGEAYRRNTRQGHVGQ